MTLITDRVCSQVQMKILVQINQSGVPAVEQILRIPIADFFSISEANVRILVANRRNVLDAAVDVVVYQDHARFLEELEETQLLLQEYLNSLQGRRQSVDAIFQVLSMRATCGRGYTTRSGSNSSSSTDADECFPCTVGTYKQALDNSACVKCASRHASTNMTGAIDVSSCGCVDGYSLANISDTSTNYTLTCVGGQQYVSVENAIEASRAISAAVGTVVAANVAVGVATAVASSVSSAVAASSGATVGGATAGSGGAASGSSAGSSSGGTLTLITQVQFLNQAGRVGGTQASPSISEFSG